MKEKQSLYIDLYEKLKKQIIEGQYQSNDRFPSKRQLSEHLSLSQTTIEHAYQLLLDEGFIYSKPRSGYYVSDIESLPVLPKQYVVPTTTYNNNENLDEDKEHYAYSFNLSKSTQNIFPHIYLENMQKMYLKIISLNYYKEEIIKVNLN